MRSIVIFKLSRDAPVSAMFNIQARGNRHAEGLQCDMPVKMGLVIGMLNSTRRETIWPQLARRTSGHSLK
jgi:hypothetical protein